ncbi:MAG: beta-hydroxyacyl-ACP dehydratase [Nitrospiraceae bacterium]|nr:MAG: beta-hydroxyacyl-ACP dehydratase [Nitrospiraceae bacterium]
MRYLLIDHITDWKSGESIKGVKNVAMSEDFLEFHFPKNPIMPGVLLLEALTQLAGWLEAASSDFSNWFLISRVVKSNFYSFALPGDQVELEVNVIEGQEGVKSKMYRGIGTVNGKKKIVAEFEGEVIPFEEIEDPDEQRRFFQVLARQLK